MEELYSPTTDNRMARHRGAILSTIRAKHKFDSYYKNNIHSFFKFCTLTAFFTQ